VASQAHAESTRPLAYNQGFCNLFLAIGAFIGVGFVALGPEGSAESAAGWILVFSSCGSMLLAAAVLAFTGRKYLRPAAIQGTTPLLAVVLGLLALLWADFAARPVLIPPPAASRPVVPDPGAGARGGARALPAG
jgi:putative membrane protein